MAKKESVEYVCNNCGAVTATWSGKCYTCGQWNTLSEQLVVLDKTLRSTGRALKTQSVKTSLTQDQQRLTVGINEIDAVFGGGIVAGSVNIIAGEPGIGKSTLLLQAAYSLASRYPVLYVSGEESSHQIGLRAKRLGAEQQRLQLATSTVADDIAATIRENKYRLVIVDSIQTVAVLALSSAAGSIHQITNSTQMLAVAAKDTDTALILVGHVTKEGSIAGPKILEHIVDVVLQLEGDRYGGFKMLRTIKNRYGSTNEAGIFEMTDKGLMPVQNPSAALLAERQVASGSVVTATLEGVRPLLVEVQALVNRTNYGYPKRAASGFELTRLNLLIAMLERRTKLNLADKDIYVNIVGGLQIHDTSTDLAVCMAIASAARDMILKDDIVIFGEVGLSGEIRHVPLIDRRLAEAKKLGFDLAVGPMIRNGRKSSKYHAVTDIRQALNTFLRKRGTNGG